ncbi:receptor-like protein kinase 5 [Durio zibethinus]|uniref:Receptor-like protein kinase 5 n=1 Tax=Durio zibethinus TaxID=66656 RepID=A0A6P5X1U6_DURZI|nr:receptor-like protein kinase 5 [Durio zibethinus]
MARDMHPSVSASWSTIFPIVLTFIPTIVHSITLQSDIETLQSLKNSIDPNTIPPSSYLSTWDFSVDPCESTGARFLGILCSIPSDSSTYQIISLELDGAGYDGFLSPNVGNFTELTSLDLSRNRFRGPLPDTLKKLKKLIRISFSGNFFTGGIAGWIYGLKMVERIDLSRNLLSGRIPARISELRRLTHLSLSNNGFSGRIPDINGLWQLQTLELGSNMLVGSLPKFPTRLRTLTLSHNRLSGHITPLEMLEQLRSVDVSDNRFSGSIGKGILALPHLHHLNVSFNQLRAIEVNKSRGSGSPLQVLDAQGNRLQGHLPLELVNFGRLEIINLAYNGLTGRIPATYGQRLGRPWRTLFLDDNFLSGRLPPQFNSSTATIRGSLANNCLMCPINIPLCRGGQRPASGCIGETDDN